MARLTWRFRLERERIDDEILVVSMAGRLSAAEAHLLDDAFTAPKDVAVVVDLEALDYISGPGLAALGAAAGRAATEKRQFVVCGVQEAVLTCCGLAGLLPTLVVEPDRARALATVASGERPSRVQTHEERSFPENRSRYE
jgi:anti-anti-sigma factor